MFEKLKWIGLGILLTLVGLLLIVMGVTEPDYSLGSRIFSTVCGLIFIIPVILIAAGALGTKRPADDGKNKKVRAGNDTEIGQNRDMFSGFRRDYALFYSHKGIHENEDVQDDVTQLYRNILEFRKKRLDRKNITLRFSSERKIFPDISPVSEDTRFDGKYEVTEYMETVSTHSDFLQNGRVIHSVKADQAAYYTAIVAKQIGNAKVICPNCGNISARETLLDGCDYCKTVFTVEDLGTKIADFNLRSNYRIQYAKYKKRRRKFGLIAFLAVAVPVFLCSMGVYLSSGSELSDTVASPISAYLAMPLASAFAAAMFGFLGMCFFLILIFPLIQLTASFRYLSKKHVEEVKKAESKNLETEEIIRKADPMFSGTGFCSSVQSKLAAIHYADTDAAVNAFSETSLSRLRPLYETVIDMETVDIAFENYRVSEDLQHIDVKALLRLTMQIGSSVTECNEEVFLHMIRSAACRTEAICGPSVFRCKSCGASISLTEGRFCSFCGSPVDLKKYDFIISDYKTNII